MNDLRGPAAGAGRTSASTVVRDVSLVDAAVVLDDGVLEGLPELLRGLVLLVRVVGGCCATAGWGASARYRGGAGSVEFGGCAQPGGSDRRDHFDWLGLVLEIENGCLVGGWEVIGCFCEEQGCIDCNV